MTEQPEEITGPFIGDKKIEKVDFVEDTQDVIVTFDDMSATRMSHELFELISHDDKRSGGIVDAVRHQLATEVIARLASLGLDFYIAEHVAEGVRTLAHNLREKEIARRFGCTSAAEIKLSDLIPE